MTGASEPPPSLQSAFEAELAGLEDPLAGTLEQLRLQAENHREHAADLLRAADRADRRARRLAAYRYATEVFAGDPQAADVAARLAEDWSGDGPPLVTVVREILRATDDR
ncbi:MAG: hypothetical protein ACXVXD_16210 [Nocardioidaceae bacterium]